MAKEPDPSVRPRRPAPAKNRNSTAAAKEAGEVTDHDPGAADEQGRPQTPAPSTEDLERLRIRLIAKHHGRRR